MFKKIRIGILLFILFLVGANAYLTNLEITDWDQPVSIVLYPVNADGSSRSSEYIASLTLDTFKPAEHYLQAEGSRYSLELAEPVNLDLAPEVRKNPPPPPEPGNIPAIMLWSLRLRFWAWKNDTYSGPLRNIQVFILYHDPEPPKRLNHSLGLKEGHVCIVNAFATRHQAARNNVVIVHEVLHTLGATDKYDPMTLQPLYPEGYAEPGRKPLLPQRYAEIMGGTIPLASSSKMPDSLAYTRIGPETAREINWLE